MKLIASICLLLFMSIAMWAQQGYVSDTTGAVLFKLDDTQILTPTDEVKFSITGNILFKGESQKKRDIVMLVNSNNVFGNKLGRGLADDMRTPIFNIYQGHFYLGGYATKDEYLMAYYKKADDGSIEVYKYDNTRLATIYGEALTNGQLAISFYLLMQQYGLDEETRENLATMLTEAGQNFRQSGTIRKLWNTGDDEFIWDGYTIKRRFNSFDYEEWSFDGRTLRRAWYDGGSEYVWDGQTLKEQWSNTNEEFIWDGKIIRSRWSQTGKSFQVQGNIVRPVWDSTGDEEWQIDGNVPIPIVIMVVFGLLRK